jgi:hypothetical protein
MREGRKNLGVENIKKDKMTGQMRNLGRSIIK